jgi:hypothetical protein
MSHAPWSFTKLWLPSHFRLGLIVLIAPLSQMQPCMNTPTVGHVQGTQLLTTREQ